MIVAIDVSYNDEGFCANAVVFSRWADKRPLSAYSLCGKEIPAPYSSGNFALREMPIILRMIEKIKESVTTLIIDGYVDLADRPGMGRILWETLGRKVVIVGVAKTPFAGSVSLPTVRKGKPLFVSAAGMGLEDASNRVLSMHGKHRIPALLKRVDRGTPIVPADELIPTRVESSTSGSQFLQVT